MHDMYVLSLAAFHPVTTLLLCYLNYDKITVL